MPAGVRRPAMPRHRRYGLTHHFLEPRPGTVHDYFSRALPPVLHVDSGDTVTVTSLDARGYLEEPTADGEFGETFLPGARGHALCGPIFVRSALPGTALAINLVNLRTGDWGWTIGGDRKERFMDYLDTSTAPMVALQWRLDSQTQVATTNLGFSVDMRPFLGVIGLAPAEDGEFSTTPPRYCGGNLDCKDLVRGSVLYLPVSVEGALLSVGDGHARQGDGEVSGSAIECPTTAELQLTPYAKTPSSRITFGFDRDLNIASAAALDAMLTWMEGLFAVTRSEALALASTVVDLRITQVANGVWGVHAVLEDDALRRSAG